MNDQTFFPLWINKCPNGLTQSKTTRSRVEPKHNSKHINSKHYLKHSEATLPRRGSHAYKMSQKTTKSKRGSGRSSSTRNRYFAKPRASYQGDGRCFADKLTDALATATSASSQQIRPSTQKPIESDVLHEETNKDAEPITRLEQPSAQDPETISKGSTTMLPKYSKTSNTSNQCMTDINASLDTMDNVHADPPRLSEFKDTAAHVCSMEHGTSISELFVPQSENADRISEKSVIPKTSDKSPQSATNPKKSLSAGTRRSANTKNHSDQVACLIKDQTETPSDLELHRNSKLTLRAFEDHLWDILHQRPNARLVHSSQAIPKSTNTHGTTEQHFTSSNVTATSEVIGSKSNHALEELPMDSHTESANRHCPTTEHVSPSSISYVSQSNVVSVPHSPLVKHVLNQHVVTTTSAERDSNASNGGTTKVKSDKSIGFPLNGLYTSHLRMHSPNIRPLSSQSNLSREYAKEAGAYSRGYYKLDAAPDDMLHGVHSMHSSSITRPRSSYGWSRAHVDKTNPIYMNLRYPAQAQRIPKTEYQRACMQHKISIGH